jgi:hypothetical protein
MRKVQENQEWLELNGIHRLVVDKSTSTIKWNTEALLEATRQIGLEVNTEKAEYMVASCHQNAGQNHDFLIINKSFESAVKFKYLGTSNKSKLHPGRN